MVYCVGSLVLSVAAIPSSLVFLAISVTFLNLLSYLFFKKILTIIGLFLIAVGTGGIKSCVSAFIGDQFGPGQEKLMDSVFAMFYFAINLGFFIHFPSPLCTDQLIYS